MDEPEGQRHLGAVLRAARTAAGLSQVDVAAAIGITQSRLSAWERGTAVPHHYRLEPLADAYGLDLAELDKLWEAAKLAQLRGPQRDAVLSDEIAGLQAKMDETNALFLKTLDRLEQIEARVAALEAPQGRRRT